MGLPMLNSFLGCWTVRTGALIIGWMSLIHSSFSVVNIFLNVLHYYLVTEREQTEIPQWYSNSTGLYYTGPKRTIIQKYLGRAGEQVAFAIVGILMLVKVALDILYLVGAYKKNKCFMIPTIGLYALGCSLVMIGVAIMSFSTLGLWILELSVGETPPAFGMSWLITFLLIIAAGISVYTYLTIYSYYRMVDQEQEVSEDGALLKDDAIDKEQIFTIKTKEFSKDCIKT